MQAALAIKKEGNKEDESLPVHAKYMEEVGAAMSMMSEPDGKLLQRG